MTSTDAPTKEDTSIKLIQEVHHMTTLLEQEKSITAATAEIKKISQELKKLWAS